MLIVAIVQGYKEIYLTGIDFYDGGGVDYAFSVKNKKNLLEALPTFRKKDFKDRVHSKELDLKAIEIAKKIEKIKIYCLNPNSLLSKIVPLAPIREECFIKIEDKPEDSIRDFVQLPNQSKEILETNKLFKKFKIFLKQEGFFDVASKNLFFRILRDFVFFIKILMGFVFFLFRR